MLDATFVVGVTRNLQRLLMQCHQQAKLHVCTRVHTLHVEGCLIDIVSCVRYFFGSVFLQLLL